MVMREPRYAQPGEERRCIDGNWLDMNGPPSEGPAWGQLVTVAAIEEADDETHIRIEGRDDWFELGAFLPAR